MVMVGESGGGMFVSDFVHECLEKGRDVNVGAARMFNDETNGKGVCVFD